jgi:transcriptional regulator with XRE-family HTH domain
MPMDFRRATDELFEGISHQDLADALGMSVATIRQARQGEDGKSHRSPPKGWEPTVAKLARARGAALVRLAERLQS